MANLMDSLPSLDTFGYSWSVRMMFGFISEIKGKNSENLPDVRKTRRLWLEIPLTLQYSDLDAEN